MAAGRPAALAHHPSIAIFITVASIFFYEKE
jgi:hypothetical protein